ncbi:hypothetical protein D3C83_77060 [compost metagenome]
MLARVTGFSLISIHAGAPARRMCSIGICEFFHRKSRIDCCVQPISAILRATTGAIIMMPGVPFSQPASAARLGVCM